MAGALVAKSWDNKTYVFCLSSLILTSEQCQSLSMLSRAHQGCYPSPPIHFLLPNKNNTNNNNNALRHQLLFLLGFGLVIMYCQEAILKKKKKYCQVATVWAIIRPIGPPVVLLGCEGDGVSFSGGCFYFSSKKS